MNLNLYEIIDKFNAAPTRLEKIHVLRNNDSKMLREALALTFASHIKFFTTFLPEKYVPDRDNPPEGMGWSHLGVEMRRMYLFVKDHPASKHLSEEKKTELLQNMLESLEPREAEMVIKMFRKELCQDLTADIVKEAFPGLLT